MPEDTANAPDRAAGILRDSLDVWVTQGKRLHDRSREKPMWSPEDIVGDTTDLMEHLTPLVERTIALGLELVRPWAVQFEARTATPTEAPAEAAAEAAAPADAVVVAPQKKRRTPPAKSTRTPAAKSTRTPPAKKGRPRA